MQIENPKLQIKEKLRVRNGMAKDKEAAEYDSRKADGKDESLQKRGKPGLASGWKNNEEMQRIGGRRALEGKGEVGTKSTFFL